MSDTRDPPAPPMEETIAAIATSPGPGGISVLRMSGKTALTIADAVFRGRGKPSAQPSHTLRHGFVMDGDQAVDEALLAVMRAPRSYTAEDVVEISCHGGLISARRTLDALVRAGARLAHPGEFTRRAFLNGRMDLTQAEAVADLIAAQSEGAHMAGLAQAQGHLYRKMQQVYDHLADALAHVEAHLDFPDEDLAPATRREIAERVRNATAFVESLLATAREGRILREGVRTVIVGKPNVGKSSLLNALLGEERAIVSATPGTTRDTIEEVASLGGIPLRIVDTAGIREHADQVEAEGIRRTHAQIARAELVLLVLDASRRLEPSDREILALCKERPLIVVLNKADLGMFMEAAAWRDLTSAAVSLKTGHGVEELKKTIARHLLQGRTQVNFHEVFINARHQEALLRSADALKRAATAFQQKFSLECIAADLREAMQALGEITGRTVTEDVLDRIFSKFCIGK
ncbi:MAG: tRNA uridine-5-carboxymethylaminomethyl(34) synthesis GTPase MnmE [Verrucomicrobiae bacterium]|nr:tRNA uridine-5-carboxymethylaminomethyl(34) synthesis GTPase MnmE [Verrucomicrobiae bacterium]